MTSALQPRSPRYAERVRDSFARQGVMGTLGAELVRVQPHRSRLQGEVGPGGGPAGDLYVELAVVSHETFRREGDNLEVVVKLPMTAAALGTTVDVATLESEWDKSDVEDRKVAVEVPAGTQSGTRIALKGRGVPRLRGGGRGDLGVTLLVQTPTKLDDRQRELLRQLAEERDESAPEAVAAKGGRGVFGKLSEWFS